MSTRVRALYIAVAVLLLGGVLTGAYLLGGRAAPTAQNSINPVTTSSAPASTTPVSVPSTPPSEDASASESAAPSEQSEVPSVLDNDTAPPKPAPSTTAPDSEPPGTPSVYPSAHKVTPGPGQPRGIRVPIKAKTIDGVASAFLVTAYSQDVRIDESPVYAFARAAVWCTPKLAEAMSTSSGGSPGGFWLDLVAHDGYTTVEVAPASVGELPPDTAISAKRVFTVDVIPHGTKGLSVEPEHYDLILTLTNNTVDGWKVADVFYMT